MVRLGESVEQKQPLLYKHLGRVFQKENIAHAYIFEGAESKELEEVALWVSQSILCQEKTDEYLACGVCQRCTRIVDGDYPDIRFLYPDGQTIKVDQIREVKQFFAGSGLESTKKILIINQAEKMTPQAANSLLKFIEEPVGDSYIFLLTHNASMLLPTIQSRCQLVTLRDRPKSQLKIEFQQAGVPTINLDLLLEMTQSVNKAVELSNDEWFNEARELIQKWFFYMENHDLQAFIFVQQHLMAHFKDKQNQILMYDILLYIVQKNSKKKESSSFDYLKMTHLVSNAKQKLIAHVSFQNVSEQLSLRAIRTC